MNKKRPNIIFMIADDHRFDALGCMGNAIVQTPHLDSLSRSGVTFESTHIMGGQYRAVCTPTRACVHTGVNAFKAVTGTPESPFDDVMKTAIGINPELACMPEVMKNAGYYTYAVGKWHNDKTSFYNGFCGGDKLFFGGMCSHDQVPVFEFNPAHKDTAGNVTIERRFSTEMFCDEAIRFIREYDKDDPFFLYLAFTSPHDPRTAPQRYVDMYPPQDMPVPDNFLPVHPFDNGEMHVRDEQLARLPRIPAEIQQHIAEYYAMVTHMDAEIGRVLECLEFEGLAENTIIVYTSDHGLSLGQHGLMGKQNVYDHSIRIPWMMKGPGIGQEVRIASLASQMDIFPTLCDLAKVTIPETVEGESLFPLITGEKLEIRESVFAVYKDLQRTVKKDGWKLIRYYRSHDGKLGSDNVQLFHVAEDPFETNNLADQPQYADRLRELDEQLLLWQRRVNDPLIGGRSV